MRHARSSDGARRTACRAYTAASAHFSWIARTPASSRGGPASVGHNVMAVCSVAAAPLESLFSAARTASATMASHADGDAAAPVGVTAPGGAIADFPSMVALAGSNTIDHRPDFCHALS